MELRFFPITEQQQYAINLKLHATEILALHNDKAELLKTKIIEKILEASKEEALVLYNKKIQNVERNI